MVVFTCNHCGESVKKSSVEKHYSTKCRGAAINLSCMDCLQDFLGDKHVAHTKCVTEAQKYSGKDYVPKAGQNRGETQQEIWMSVIRGILHSNNYTLSDKARNSIQALQKLENVPRKKAKFKNFAQNCILMPAAVCEEVWNVLEKEQEKLKLAKQQKNAAAAAKASAKTEAKVDNGVKRAAGEETEQERPAKKKSKKDKEGKLEIDGTRLPERNGQVDPPKKKSKKKAVEDNVVVVAKTNGNDEPTKKKRRNPQTDVDKVVEKASNDPALGAKADTAEEFDWSAVLQKIVGKNAGVISLDKLKKCTLKRYARKIGAEELMEKQRKKFDKKFVKSLKNSPSMQIDGEVVKTN